MKRTVRGQPNHLLRAARRARGWTQKDVADRIGAPLALNVTRWEGGKAFPSAHYIEKLCQLFEKTPEELGLFQDNDLVSLEPDQEADSPPLQQPVLPAPEPARHTSSRLLLFLLVGTTLLVIIASSIAYIGWNRSRSSSSPKIPLSATAASTTTPANATATFVAAYPDPYPPRPGKIAFYDPLSSPYLWTNDTDEPSGRVCQFKQGVYSVRETKQLGGICFNTVADEKNFAIEVQMTIIQGDCGGIIFRSNDPKEYQYTVCQTGYYALSLYRDLTTPTILINKSSPAILVGLNQTNVVAVVANGSTLDFYVNQQKIDSIQDSTYSQGQVALVAENEQSKATEVLYKDVKIWTL